MLVEKRSTLAARWPSRGNRSSVVVADARRRAQSEASLRWLENRDRGALAGVWRRFKRLVIRRLDRLNAPVVYRWSPSNTGAEKAHRLHRLAGELLAARANTVPQRLWLWAKSVVWPLVATAVAVPVWWRCAPHVRDNFGQALRDQWRDLMDAAWNHGIFPTEYYSHRVFASDAREDKAKYLNEREIIALLSAADEGVDTMRLDDVRRFHAECRAAGVRAPRSLATATNKQVQFVQVTDADSLPHKDLFLRPVDWRCGISGECWRWSAHEGTWSHRGESHDAAGLIERLRQTSRLGPAVLQECLHNHPEISRFAVGGLCTVRFATATDVVGSPRVLFASFVMPGAEMSGVAPAAVGLTSGIDLESGRLMPASGEFIVDGEFDSHPGTGVCVTGAAVPYWHAMVEMVLRAHSRFSEIPFVGWEVALTGSGLVMLEASTNWGQFLHVLPVDTEFAQLCLQRIAGNREERNGKHATRAAGRDSAGSTMDLAAGESRAG